MTTLVFSTNISATKQEVWETLWDDSTYRQWTAAFTEGSNAESDWEEGSKILFMDGKGMGMFSVIQQKIPYQQIIFKHLGEVKNGVEIPKNWGDALEGYFLSEMDGITTLRVKMDSPDEMADYFKDTFPKALAILKFIAEGKPSITTQVTVQAAIELVWQCWTTPADIMLWNNCSADWNTPLVDIDLKEGGKFLYRMELRDASVGFDHAGMYDRVITNALIEYTLADGRKSLIVFTKNDTAVIVTETFEPETTMPFDIQKDFCQKILNNFKIHVENKSLKASNF